MRTVISRTLALVFLIGLIPLIVLPGSASVTFSSSTPQIIVTGNDLTVQGTGAMNGTVALWVVGRNYIDRRVIIPDIKGNYIWTISSEDTRRFSRGQYAFVLQDSGRNGKLDVEYRLDDNGDVILQSQGKTFADIGARENLKASLVPLIAAFSAGATNPPPDDIFTAYYFFVEEPSIDFDHLSGPDGTRLPDMVAGNPAIIGGPTNLDPRDMMRAEIRDRATGNTLVFANIPVQSGATINRWSWVVESPALPPGTYDVAIWRQNAFVNSSRSAVFTVVASPAATTSPGNDTPSSLPWSHDPLLPFLILFGLALVIASILYTSRNR